MKPIPRAMAAGGGIVAVSGLLFSSGFVLLADSSGFMPHGHCYLWRPGVVMLHLTSDTLIGVSYTVIALTLAYLVHRARSALPFHWMVLAFGTFIIACGATHFMEVWTLWWPSYWFSGYVKVITALASVATAVALPPLVPRALHLVEAAEVAERRRVELDERDRLLAEAKAARAEAEAARAEAERANRTKDQFLAVVSHELRTPLSPILAWSRLLQMNPGLELERGLATIERAARTQAQIVEDLLDVSRIASGKLRLDVRPIEVGPVIEAAMESVRPAADAKGIRLLATLDADAGFVSGDPERLQQVFWNLLSNAIKFTPRGGHVEVRLERAGSEIEVTVTDTGTGIELDELPRLFERFWQADSTPSRAYGGLGLGLSIVKHIVELHGGSVTAESAGPEQGAVFQVRIPLRTTIPAELWEAPREHSAVWRAMPPPGGSLTRLDGKRLLVVDDDVDTTATLDVLFSTQGAQVKIASSVDQAFEILDGWTPHAAIVDIGMPFKDGYTFISELRKRPVERAGRIPAIALTAYARVEDRVRVLSSGFEMHVTKPVDPSELLAVVASVTRRAFA